jgi:hypothetical protein
MDDFDEMDEDMKLEYYIEIGAIELVGMDENGEIIYEITEAAEHLAPELWQSHIDYVDSQLLDLYEKGLLSVEYDENLEASISLTEDGYRIAKEHGLIQIDMDDEDIPND